MGDFVQDGIAGMQILQARPLLTSFALRAATSRDESLSIPTSLAWETFMCGVKDAKKTPAMPNPEIFSPRSTTDTVAKLIELYKIANFLESQSHA